MTMQNNLMKNLIWIVIALLGGGRSVVVASVGMVAAVQTSIFPG